MPTIIETPSAVPQRLREEPSPSAEPLAPQTIKPAKSPQASPATTLAEPTRILAPAKPRRHFRSRLIAVLVLAVIVAGIALALRPTPLDVDTAVAVVAPMRVTIDADAVTRVRQPFAITAPVGGLVQRIGVRPGDRVQAGEPLATITTAPLFTTERRAVASRVDAARATQLQFDARLSQAELALAQALRDEARARQLVAAGALAERDLELASLTVVSRRADLGTVRAQRGVALAELAQARAAQDAALGQDGATTVVRAPSGGVVLSVPQRSARVVAAGTPLLELGDPVALEVAADVLSTDAALVRAGQKVILRGWGGTPLAGVVRVVEPSARTRISALGVEEQRLTVVIDASSVPAAVGDGYRMDASIVVWEGRPLTVPASALLREGDAWHLYVVRDGRAERRDVAIGHLGGGVAEVRGGLRAGDRVVLFPPDALRDGARVRATR